jgi:hypothetical protein
VPALRTAALDQLVDIDPSLAVHRNADGAGLVAEDEAQELAQLGDRLPVHLGGDQPGAG